MEYDELPDRDLPSIPSPDDEGESMLSFPKGLRAGLFFHKLFETLEFTVSPHQQQDRVTAALESFGFESSWAQPVAAMAKQVLSATLAGAAGNLTLSTLSASDRIHEMEFYFPLNRIGQRDLKAAFGVIENTRFKTGFPERLEDLVFTPREGFMKGFIDLLACQNGRYYLIDWKSNFLGPDASWYRKERLEQVIEEAYYFLQYHLYVLAVYRYLKLRQPDFKYERDFGGVFYLFIRGIDPDQEKETGIYYDRPELKRIEALEKTLIPLHHL
ncbi:MAG: hypothetical protein A2V65_12375 [Deltaproteobacteria bacterium RBG_13_49_15]|nr:MAG: hypothetical protein A2V65_12375 [Deltaproteobacteria bacterium RBG_13_49_15]